jgi:glycosyltransferase involved in cell wall biosynthesis
VRESDVVVVPEICAWDEEVRAAPARKLVFVQNPDVLAAPLEETERDGVAVSSRPVASWLRGEFGYRGQIHFLPGFLEARYLRARRRSQRREPRLLLVDRPSKHNGEPRLVLDWLRRRGLDPTYISDPMARDAFVSLFREHDAYLHLSYREGFPTPVIEAFGSGCLVLGFAGRGGAEFMRDRENSWLFGDGDWLAVAGAAARLRELPAVEWNGLLEAAHRTACHYSEERLERALEATFRPLVGAHESVPPAAPIASG